MNPYTSFHKNNLFTIADDDYELVLVGYPEWRAFVAASGTNLWVEIIPNINLNTKSLLLPKRKTLQGDMFKAPVKEGVIDPEVIRNFFSTIPDAVSQPAAAFPDSHWEFVKAMKMIGDDFLQLIKTNPVLAYLLVNMEKMNPSFMLYTSIELLQRMIRTKRKEILRLCGYPESQVMVKIFSKIAIGILDIKILMKLRNVFLNHSEHSERIIKLLSFAKEINNNLLSFLSNDYNLFAFLPDKTIYRLSNDPAFSKKLSLLRFIYIKSNALKINLPEIKSLDNLEQRKDRLELKIRSLSKFPDPPLRGNQYIEPIRYEDELISWSKRQGNCIRYSAASVRNGRLYFYKVCHKNEEATLEIIKSKGILKFGRLLGVRNVKVSEELKIMVKDWYFIKKLQ